MTFLHIPGHVDLPGTTGNSLSVPDGAPLDVTGDLTLVARCALDDWTPAGINCVLSKWSIGNSYALYLNTATARPWLFWNDGAVRDAIATATIPGLVDGAWKWVAATLDVNNGAAGRDIRFWYGDDGVTWTQLGTTVTQAGTTSIVASTSPLDIGNISTVNNLAGLVQHVSIYNGIGAGGTVGGTEVFGFGQADLYGVDSAAATFEARTGQTVTVNRSGSPATVLVPTTLVEAADPPPSVWSVDLCRDWQRIGQLQGDAYTFDGVQRELEAGGWTLTFPDGEPAWSSHNVPDLPNYLNLNGAADSFAFTADQASLDITGNIDIRWFGTVDDLADTQTLVAKWDDTIANRSFRLLLIAGAARFYMSTNGTASTNSTSVAVPFLSGEPFGTRVTRDQATGTVTTYFSSDGITWVAAAGTSVVSAGSAIHVSTAELRVGKEKSFFGNQLVGRTQWAEVRSVIGGTVVASPDFTAQIPGTRTFVDAQANLWTMVYNAHIVQDPLVEVKVYTPDDVNTVRLIENNQIRMAGSVAQESEGVGGIERQADANGVRWVLSGPDLWHELSGRVAFPTPATTAPWAAAHDLNSGVASTALANYLSDNLGVTAIVDRQIDGFTIIDTLAGMVGDWSARLQPVVELVKRICDDAQLTVNLTVTFNGEVVVRLEPPRNLADRYMLSDQADLISVRSRLIPARSTHVIAGGQGTGTGRVFRTADTGATGRSRRERFLDQSSLADADEVQASANTTLRLDGPTWSVSAQTSDLAAESFRFGRDVYVGESITIEVNRQRFVVPVTSISWHVGADRQGARAALGVASPDALKGLLRDVGNLASRFDSNVA